MIESYYWKQELLKFAKHLRRNIKPKRWTEKQAVLFERELMITFFCIRKLFEEYRISNVSRNYRTEIHVSRRSSHPLTLSNMHDIFELYDLDNEIKIKKDIPFIANQFIHSYTIFSYKENRSPWKEVYVCSDYEKKNAIYRITVEKIIKILEIVGNDYPRKMMVSWNDIKKDISIETD